MKTITYLQLKENSMQVSNSYLIKYKLFILNNKITLTLISLHVVSMILRSRSFTFAQVLSIVIISNYENDLKCILYLYQHAIEMTLHQ